MTEKRFIGYHLLVKDPTNPEEETIPLAVARDAEECYVVTMSRVLIMGGTDGYIAVQDRTEDVTEEEFASLDEFLKNEFEKVKPS